MEWLIGLIVIYVVWRVFFAKGQASVYIKEELMKIYHSGKDKKILIESYFFYNTYRDYSLDRGGIEKIDGFGDQTIELEEIIDDEICIFTFAKSNYSGKAYISMTNMTKLEEDILNKVKKYEVK